jgi:hypothetical protein
VGLFVPSDKILLLRITTYLSMDVEMVLNVLIFPGLLRIYKTHCSLFNLYFGHCSHPILFCEENEEVYEITMRSLPSTMF